MQFKILKVETQRVWVCWICTTFRYNQTQFRREEVSSVRHVVSALIWSIMWIRKNKISFKSDYIQKDWNEEKVLRKVTNEYFK